MFSKRLALLLICMSFSTVYLFGQQSSEYTTNVRSILERVLQEKNSPPPGSVPIHIRDVVEIVLKEHPDIKKTELQVRHSQEQKKIARSSYFPQVNSYAALAHEENGSIFPFDTRADYGEVGVQPSLRFYDGGHTRAAVRAAEIRIQQTLENFRGSQLLTGLQASNIFLLVLRERLNRETSDRYVKWQQQMREKLIARGEQFSKSDLLVVDSRIEQAKAKLKEAQELEMQAENEYKRITGRDANTHWLIKPFPLDYPEAFSDGLEIVLKNHPQLNSQKLAEAAATEDIKIAKSRWKPRLDAIGSVHARDQRYGHGGFADEYKQEGGSARLQLTFPLLTGGKRRAEQRQAEMDKEIIQESISKLHLDIPAEVESLYLSLKKRAERIVILDAAVEATRKSVQEFENACENPTPPTSVVQNAFDQRALLRQNEATLNSEVYGYISDVYNLHAQMGTLFEALGVDAETLKEAEQNKKRSSESRR